MVFVAPVAEVVPSLRAVRDEVELRRLAVDLVNLACVLDTRARSRAAADEVLRLAVQVVPQLRVFLARDRDWGAAKRMAKHLDTGTHAGAKAALSDKPAGFGVGLRKR